MEKRPFTRDLPIVTLFCLVMSLAREAPHKGRRPLLNTVTRLSHLHIPAKTALLVLLISPLLVLVGNGLNRSTGTMLPQIS